MAEHIYNTNSALIKYNDSSELFHPNFNDNAEMLASTGYTSATTKTLAELTTELYDGTDHFCSGSNLVDPLGFQYIQTKSGATISANDLSAIKIRINRLPDITYNDKNTIGQDVDVNGSFQYIATVDVYEGTRFVTTFNYTMQFIEDDFKVYTFSDISYTDPDTGLSATLDPLNITYQAVGGLDPTLKSQWDLTTDATDSVGGFDFITEVGTPTYGVDGVSLNGSTSLIIPFSVNEFLQDDEEWSFMLTMKKTVSASAGIFGKGAQSDDKRMLSYTRSSDEFYLYPRAPRVLLVSHLLNTEYKLFVVKKLISGSDYEYIAYVDGVLAGTISGVSVDQDSTSSNIRIGAYVDQDVDGYPSAVLTGYLTGSVKDVRYYTRALEQSDATAYQNGDPIPIA